MNKKAQIVPSEGGMFGNTHPVLVIGIFVFVVPFFSSVIKIKIPGFVSGIGLVLILLGAGLSIMKSSNI